MVGLGGSVIVGIVCAGALTSRVVIAWGIAGTPAVGVVGVGAEVGIVIGLNSLKFYY